MDSCPACGTTYKSSRSRFCSKCGHARPMAELNVCTNLSCLNHRLPLDQDAQYCDLCGSLTTLGKMINDMP